MIINCKDKATRIKYEIREEVSKLEKKPHLCIIQVGENEASNRYVRNKIRDCEFVGMDYTKKVFPEDATTEEVVQFVQKMNENSDINGIIVQLPVPKTMDKTQILSSIAPEKDVDGLTKNSPFIPCTPKGIMTILEDEYLSGKHAVIINRSDLVGKPLINLLLDKDMTVTVCHSKTPEYKMHELCRQADLIISAVGKGVNKIFRTLGSFKDNAIVIDVGINFDINGKICGDLKTDYFSEKVNITPVPNGVGLMTRVSLLQNTLEAYHMQNN